MPKRNLIWIFAILTAAAVTLWVTRKEPPGPNRAEPDEFDGVASTYCLIKDRYHRPIDGRELRSGAVNGMVSELDEFSSYISAAKLDAFASRMMGVDRGLGLRLEQADADIRVIGPLPNSPAHKAGIVSGDVIVAVDGDRTAGMTLGEVRDLLKGEFDTGVELTIARAGGWRKAFTLKRDEFAIESIQGLYRDLGQSWVYMPLPADGLAYVRLKEFVRGTGRQFQEVLRRLDGLRGLVLDLRDNPGGMLPEAVATADLLLREGVIVAFAGRNEPAKQYLAEPDGTFPEFPVVVLIDAGTASGAEIVAGALRLHDRAVLVGTRTRGKGAVQTMFRLADRLGQINLTTSQLLIGADQLISRMPGSDDWGVDPHDGLEVVIPAPRRRKLRQLRLRVEVLGPSVRTRPATRPATAATAAHPMYRKFMSLDSQLTRAIELLQEPAEIEEILRAAAETRAELQRQATRLGDHDDE